MNRLRQLFKDLVVQEEQPERADGVLYSEFYNLCDITNWPKIENEGEWEENLDLENCGIINIDDSEIKIMCGGDWQAPHLVILHDNNGVLEVKSFRPLTDEEDMDDMSDEQIMIALEI